MTSADKITAEHLSRPAYVYVRQSSRDQVRHHLESQRRQYGLRDRAHELGWQEVVVIDDDLGKSGSTIDGRVGFQRLVAIVGLGQAGAVLSTEVSRFARNNRDWYQLLDLCGLMNTLIVDVEGIYDTRQPNDRLLLGLKGTMSEAELGWLRQRAYAAAIGKAKRGELLLGVPTGFVRSPDGRIDKHPDRRVQEAIELVFAKFAELGSVRQVLLWFRHEQIAVPTAGNDTSWGQRVSWRLPVYNWMYRTLRNPTYAGAYAFGRRETRTTVVDGAVRKSKGHDRAREQWLVLLPDHHAGYIDWQTYERNQQRIADNAQTSAIMAKGAVREGQSLLCGLLLCGHCGRRMNVAYGGNRQRVPRYHCGVPPASHGTAGCISFGGWRVDQAVESEVLAVLQPGAIEAALATAGHGDADWETRRRAVELEVREARYEAGRAQRQYDSVEPENRLVAETLEQRWNEALAKVAQLDQRLAALDTEREQHVAPNREQLLRLAQSFPAIWNDPDTDQRTKKRLVRLLIEQIVARVSSESMLELVIHWKGGKHTRLHVRKNRTGEHRHCTSREVIDLVRELARQMPDVQITRVLNRLGYRTGAGNTWTESRVCSLRSTHEIPLFDPACLDGERLSLAQAATELGVSPDLVRRLIKRGVLPATQPVMHAPWSIRRDDLQKDTVRRAVDGVTRGQNLPRGADPAQLSLIKSTT